MIAAPPPPAIAADAGELELARAGVQWFERVEELAKRDPVAAEKLYGAMWAHLAHARPESPCSLSERFAPTEAPATR